MCLVSAFSGASFELLEQSSSLPLSRALSLRVHSHV